MTPIKGRPKLKYRGLLLANRIVLLLSTAFLAEWAIYGIFRCPFIVPFVSCQNCPVITCPGRAANMFWGFWGAALALLVLFGRAFCGWFCPGCFVNRVFDFNPFKIKIKLKTVNFLSLGKYVGLAVALWAYFVMGQPRLVLPIRAGEFWQSIPLTFDFASYLWLFRTWFVITIFALGIVLAIAWCRYACPHGAILEFFKRFSFFKVYKTNKCNDCNKCRQVCYMQTRPEETNCTNCADCIQVCPQNAIGIGRIPKGEEYQSRK